ncbi:MAG: SLBB domain-containing protein [Sandaracinaceae bacterium]|nr:SLBB domain-containing protein [Sandaracinaceae bacterium]
MRTSLALLVCVFSMVGCGGYVPAPLHPSERDFQRELGPAPEGIADDPAEAMTLYAGDVLTVRTVSSETQEILGIVVDAAGRIHVPLAGDVEVGGLTLGTAETRVEEAMRAFDRFVRVSLRVTDSAGHTATVLGAVSHPGTVRLSPGTRVADLVAMSGGSLAPASQDGTVSEVADFASARLYRNGVALPISVARALRGEPRQNVRVHPGDSLFVPYTRTTVTIVGQVTNPHEISYRAGLRLTQALAGVNGLTRDGDDHDVRVLRGPVGHQEVYIASLQDIVDGDAQDIELAPGDVLYVGQHPMAGLGEFLERIGPLFSAGISIGVTALIISASQ